MFFTKNINCALFLQKNMTRPQFFKKWKLVCRFFPKSGNLRPKKPKDAFFPNGSKNPSRDFFQN